MHIPGCLTSETEVLPFQKALDAALMPSNDYDAAQWLYVPNTYQEYRYILGILGDSPLICLGVNPSTAVPGNLDKTLNSVERVARSNGFDSFFMLNVYAQRATRPEDMEWDCNPFLHRQNLEAFAYCLERCPDPPTVWAAWGAVIEKRPYLKECVRDFITVGEKYHAHWVTAGPRSKKGHPHHPLYLKKDAALDGFDVVTYCQEGQERTFSL